MPSTLNWGILATGGIAEHFAKALPHTETGQLVAVGSRTQKSADRFAARHGAVRAHGSYDALLADPQVEAVYIATPHPGHAEWTIKAAEAGKHILCEKPIGMNHAEAMVMIEAARRHDVFLMEAFMYRCHPQTAKLIELVKQGVIGDIRLIRASFGFKAPKDERSRLINNQLGGGAILDIGCYTVSMSRLIVGVARGDAFAEPTEVTGAAHLGPTGVDHWAVATLTFPGDVLAQVSVAVTVALDNLVEIVGSQGRLVVEKPWMCSGIEGGRSRIMVKRNNESERVVEIKTDQWLYGVEADVVAAHLDQGQAAWPAMTWADTLGNMATVDRWRASIGLEYEQEKPVNYTFTSHRRPLAVREPVSMKYGSIKGIDKRMSRIVLGTSFAWTMPRLAVIFDDYFERGGNVYDTAFVYAGGSAEKLLGHWLVNRGVRDQVVLIGKGAHTPHCRPEAVAKQLAISLDRLQTDHVDIYVLHRDDPQVPVGEFVDVLYEQQVAGRLHVYGGSNWTIDRMVAANEYASSRGIPGFTVLSNNFSLARMVRGPWEGVRAASDDNSRAWLTETQTPLLPWSSQAQGFFTDRAGPEKKDDLSLVRSWYGPDNFERRRRAFELASEKGVEPTNIALAYVLQQPFPTFAVVGPLLISETASCFEALKLALTPDEIAWLDLKG